MNGSTIISYHSPDLPATTAPYLHKRRSPDPTLVLLIFLWHAFCGWDSAIESLHQHMMALENDIPTAQMLVSGELPRIRAHHLHYSSLLDHFIKAVDFVQQTPTPFMTPSNFDQALLDENALLMTRECRNLRNEIERLKAMLYQQEQRLKNLMTATDREYMKKMAQATTRDGAAMKQIAYLTMVFLPPSFVATVFGMNVFEISPDAHATIPQYVAIALPLTVLTMWIVIAFRSKIVLSGQVPFWLRLIWPLKKLHARYNKNSKAHLTDHDIEKGTGKRLAVPVAPKHASHC
ncbi:hypothetical protein EST38_g8185 [Candolleomyces aberdarensis]|uniref:Uncharacterized protein n=1 Tax=Candolleomyces aberdarensis TaxID=2316362 RepID=A0A4Q2DFF6_9AGAR|nr:hypothetical protein EST38_g8185 [Candolleomyces aberdarensis]